jgi:hypothetical protein
MGKGRRSEASKPRRAPLSPPIPLEAVDLLAGLAPGVELQADDLPPGIVDDPTATAPAPSTVTVSQAGKLVRAGDGAVRRLVRGRVIAPGSRELITGDDRAGVLPRTPDKPGE